MYSGTTIGSRSGNFIGAHQRIDRAARKQLAPLLPENVSFPTIKDILYFEGNNGPDSVKRKSPSTDEPWHYIDPKKPHDISLVGMVVDHSQNLTVALRKKNQERAAFEAAWLAHAIVDGLTPAHHFPLAEKIEELFGMAHDERKTIRQKNLIKGENRRDSISKNWEYWGAQGIFSAHFLFEFGVSTTMLGRTYRTTISEEDIRQVEGEGYDVFFVRMMQEIDALNVYTIFRRNGWNASVARLVHKELLPRMIKAVTLAWYAAVKDAR